MESNIYKQLSKLREVIKKEEFNSFSDLLLVVSKKIKNYDLLPLFSIVGNVARLKILYLSDLESIDFEIPIELVGVQNAKEWLYNMAFDIIPRGEGELPVNKRIITPEQYLTLLERMKEKKVTEKEILERYQIERLTTMTADIYQRCMTVLDKMKQK